MLVKLTTESAPLKLAPALLANIRLGWKWLSVTNALTYNTAVLIVATKIQAPELPGMKMIRLKIIPGLNQSLVSEECPSF
jgi:hypothetical protein